MAHKAQKQRLTQNLIRNLTCSAAFLMASACHHDTSQHDAAHDALSHEETYSHALSVDDPITPPKHNSALQALSDTALNLFRDNTPKTLSDEQEIIETSHISTRDLTAAEKTLLNGLFGSNIRTSHIKIATYHHTHTDLPANVLPQDTQIIRIYGRSNMSEDYSLDHNVFRYGVFIRQATKIAQNQHRHKWHSSGSDTKLYPLNIDDISQNQTFERYSKPQQAQIIEDYARRFLHPVQTTFHKRNGISNRNCNVDWALINIVEDAFPQAQKLREDALKHTVRPLTRSEINFVYAIFGDQINLEQVKIHLQNINCTKTKASVNSPHAINFWGKSDHSQDYFHDYDPDNFGTFLHEALHIWQRQTRGRYTNTDPNIRKIYDYHLDSQTWNFHDYGIEQQASMVEDYARTFLHPDGIARRNWNDAGQEELKKTIEAAFPQAKITRDFFEKHQSFPTYQAEHIEQATRTAPSFSSRTHFGSLGNAHFKSSLVK